MPDQEMTFDAAPVKQDTPTSQPTASNAGMTFDSSPVKQDTSVQQATAPNGMPANNMQAVANEQTPEGHAAAVAGREAQHPVVTGLGEASGDVWDAVKSMANPLNSGLAGATTQAYEHIKEAVPLFQTYEKARANGKTVIESLGAANAVAKQIHDAQDVLAQRVDEFKKTPTVAATRAVADAAALAATMWSGGEPLEAPAASAEAKAAGNITHVFNPTTETLTPVDQAVARNAAKSGLPVGTLKTVAPTGEDIQPSLQKGVHSVMADVAKESGVEAPNPNSVRDVAKNTADQVLAKSKDAYAQLDEASGGRWQRFDDQLKNVRDKMREVSGIDDDKYAELEQKQNEIETSQAQLIEDMKEAGKVDPALADEARANYKKAQALYDVDSQIKMSTTGRAGVGQGVETVDPNKLVPRLHKLYDSGRLQQAVGEDRAAALIGHSETAQTAVQVMKDFEPSSPTGQKAMQDLLRPSTKGKLIGSGANTDFLKSYRDFDALTPEEQNARFGNDVGQARDYLKSQARNQIIRKWGVRAGLGLIAHETGLDKALLHAIWD